VPKLSARVPVLLQPAVIGDMTMLAQPFLVIVVAMTTMALVASSAQTRQCPPGEVLMGDRCQAACPPSYAVETRARTCVPIEHCPPGKTFDPAQRCCANARGSCGP
jgi:hypothetical protein